MSRAVKLYRLETGSPQATRLSSPEGTAWLELDADQRLELIKRTPLTMVMLELHERDEAVVRFGAYLELLERAQGAKAFRDQGRPSSVTDLCTSPPRSRTTVPLR